MIRSMYSGVSGMKGFQTKLDVIGNNIANINTVGFKKSNINFQDMFSQSLSGSSVNPMQIGLGSVTSAINVIHNQGASMSTGVGTDLAIQGEGFFVVQDPADAGTEDGRFLTRAGNFGIDGNGNLVTSQGYNVLGDYQPTPPGILPADALPVDKAGVNVNGVYVETIPATTPASYEKEEVVSYSINRKGEVIGKAADGREGVIATLSMASPENPSGLSKFGGSLYEVTAASGGSLLDDNLLTAEGVYSEIGSGMLEMSNVDLTEEFTEMILAQRGFQANSRTITTSDEMLQEVFNLKR